MSHASAVSLEAPGRSMRPPCRLWRTLRFSGLALTILLAACDQPPAASPDKQSGAAPAVSGVSGASSTPTFRDWPREPLVDPAEGTVPDVRIVSAAPNLTEICCALGLRDRLVGRTRYCTYPPEVEAVPAIGGLIDGSVESLVALKPDVVLIAGTSRALADRLAPLGLKLESLPDRSLDDLFETITRLGERLGRPKTAAALVTGIQRELAAAAGPVSSGVRAAETRATALLLTGTLADPPRPPFAAGPGSFYDDLLVRAGLRNVVTDSTAAFAPVSLEFILAADPRFIFELDPAEDRPAGDAGALAVWSKVGSLSAVREGRVHVLRGGQHYILGPRIAGTLAEIVRLTSGVPPSSAGASAASRPARAVSP